MEVLFKQQPTFQLECSFLLLRSSVGSDAKNETWSPIHELLILSNFFLFFCYYNVSAFMGVPVKLHHLFTL